MEKAYKILKLVLLVLIFVALLLGAMRLYDNLGGKVQMDALGTQAAEEAQDTKKNPAPDFTVYDIDGNPCRLSDFRGKPVILNFWATWCGYCQIEMPAFEEKYQQYGEQIHFLMMNVTDGRLETKETASSFIAEHGYSFPVYFDTERDAAYSYNTSSLPVTYFIDAQGNYVGRKQGVVTDEILQTGIDMLLGE